MRLTKTSMKLIVGLGNPGRSYANNRHNLGFICLSYFAQTHSLRFYSRQGQARIGSGDVAGNKVVVARPQTYMNQSGQAVSRLVRKFKISLDDLLVIHDDLDLPLAKIRIRPGGSAAGHKGVESIIAELGSQDFARIRVGIGQPAAGASGISETDIVTYVLSDFPPEERRIITQVIPTVSEAILCFLSEGLTAVMNKYN